MYKQYYYDRCCATDSVTRSSRPSTLRRPETWSLAWRRAGAGLSRARSGRSDFARRTSVDADIEAAFDAGRILRTHVLRPTWHFVARRGHPLDACADRTACSGASIAATGIRWPRRTALRQSRRTRRRTRARMGASLDACRDLAPSSRQARIEATGQRLASPACWISSCRASSAAARDAAMQFTYASLSACAAGASSRREEALAELAPRYFRSHGPATLRTYAWWSGLTMREAKSRRRGPRSTCWPLWRPGPDMSQARPTCCPTTTST